MCETCSQDPRDVVSDAERALLGLRTIINHLPLGVDVPSDGVGAIIDFIHERLGPAVVALQGYVPRDRVPPDA